ncbi:MAG: tRNA uridine-5-carboxymethylaminomethyl(34) synthesis GTPase MnmE [Acidobacteria bacterium]|nr:MAG: tRNA uridine-5-carboxymethylaminomethyl(34) synthesis GTPase MnmE [Acidobacteriota bacterium]
MAQKEGDTIVAPATPPGRGALAVVRLSGSRALEVARRVAPSLPARPRPRYAHLTVLSDRSGRELDTAVAVWFPAPRSYTGEEMVEITCHGSPAVVRELLAACRRAGARPADPGEFTVRAVRNGKLDLTQAEAIADLVEAATVEQAHLAARQLRGEVARALQPLAEEVASLLAELEAGLDFPDEEERLRPDPERLGAKSRELAGRLEALLERSAIARRVREGALVVLHGPANAGKSSLFNNLVGSDRAIVTDEPGTTRDLVEEVVVIEGLPVRLVDAAGVGAAVSKADAAGQERAWQAAREADLVLRVYALTTRERPAPAGPRELLVATHGDRPPAAPPVPGSLVVSNVTGAGIDRLRAEIARRLEAPGEAPLESVALANERHRHAADRARAALERAGTLLGSGGEPELAALELRQAVGHLREILGQVGPEEILERIFSRFCIGK